MEFIYLYKKNLLSRILIDNIFVVDETMVNGRIPSVFSKTYVTPRRPYEKARLDQELRIIGEYGLRNKREVWRVKYTLAKIRKAARELLTLEEKDQKRLFEGIFLKVLLIHIFLNSEFSGITDSPFTVSL